MLTSDRKTAISVLTLFGMQNYAKYRIIINENIYPQENIISSTSYVIYFTFSTLSFQNKLKTLLFVLNINLKLF
jgi:hypothetical protein